MNLTPVFFVPLAHGVFGPFDELLPIALIVVLAGLLGFTWWNGRKAPLPPDDPVDAAAVSEPVTPTAPTETTAAPDESHYTVQ